MCRSISFGCRLFSPTSERGFGVGPGEVRAHARAHGYARACARAQTHTRTYPRAQTDVYARLVIALFGLRSAVDSVRLWTSVSVAQAQRLATLKLYPSKVTHFLLTALHRTATFGPDPARPSFDLAQTPLGTDLGCVFS